MRILCPNCQHGLEIVADVAVDTVTCPSCGSQLNPDPTTETVSYQADARKMIGRFELLEHVGKGHFGNVWRARDTQLKRIVAVKIPRIADLTDGEKQLFLREAQAAARLRHRNIVAVHEVGFDAGVIYIVSDFVSGVPLNEQLNVRRPSFTEAAQWCAAIADALDYAHSQGIIHRDIKPSNVMLEAENDLFVLDFGLAKMEGGDFTITSEGDILGTPAYMSPEQARGHSGAADRRSDIYSVGVMLYELLTGSKPFQGSSRSLMHQILHEEPKPPRRINRAVPRDLETICMKAMAKQPGQRYASAAEMADDLRRTLAGQPIRARPVQWPERSWRWAKRNPALAVTAALAFGGALLAAILGRQLIADNESQPVMIKVLQRTTADPQQQPAPLAQQCTAAFWHLDAETGQPQTDHVVRARGAGNLRARLLPGDYLVVVDIPGHGFHEVLRHVAAEGEQPTLGYKTHSFEFNKDGSQTLPEIEVPPDSAASGMISIAAGDFQLGPDGTHFSRAVTVHVPAFFMDPFEVSIADYRRIRGAVPQAIQNTATPEDHAVHHVHWFEAMMYAERLGKRLPEEAEYEAVATNFGRQKYPWDGVDALSADWPLEAVGQPETDRATAAPAVGGLFSNVGEWTLNWATLPPDSPIANPQVHVQRIVRGAPPSVIAGNSTAPIDQAIEPRSRMFHDFEDQQPGLGFRCVRSAKPRLRKEDF